VERAHLDPRRRSVCDAHVGVKRGGEFGWLLAFVQHLHRQRERRVARERHVVEEPKLAREAAASLVVGP
jgi:hypothetical protein